MHLHIQSSTFLGQNTGSSRKNDKSKTVFTSLNFCKSWVFSAVLGQELAANSSSSASRSITITRWHPQKLTPPMCFRALVGCFRPTTHSETLSKDPKSVFWFVRDEIGKIKENKCVHSADFAANKTKHTLFRGCDAVVGLKQPTRAWKQIGGVSF